MKGIPRTSAFVGRESYLDKMTRQLSPASAARRRRVCVLHGLGGIGKTQLAIEYARLHKHEYSSFFWLDGKTEESLIQSLISIISRLPQALIPGFDIDEVRGMEDSKKKAQEVLRWFALEGNGAWLLIYDNVDKTSYGASDGDAESQACYNIEEYLPSGDAGAIVITSRLQRLAKLGEQVHVRKIDILNGVLILEKQSGKSFRCLSHPDGGSKGINSVERIDAGKYDINQLYSLAFKSNVDVASDALALVERLDGLPLALVIAGSYISRTAISKYLEFYNTSWNSLQESFSFSPDYPGRTIITTWKISYDELKRKNEGAARLLQLWAYLDNRDVWYELFRWPQWGHQAPDWLLQLVSTEITFLDAIGMLLEYSLVEKNEGLASYSMHAVVHDWIREIVNRDDDGAFLKIAVGTVGLWADSASEKEEQDCRAVERRVLPHAIRISQQSFQKAVLRHDPSLKSKGGGYFLVGLRGLGAMFHKYCLFAESESMYQRLLREQENTCGAESLSTFHTLHELGSLYRDQGKYREAEVVLQRALKGRETALGMEHALTLISVNGLALVFRLQGKPSEANALFERAVAGKEELCTKENVSVSELDILQGIGAMYQVQGRAADAERVLRKVLTSYEKIRGKEHKDTLQAAWRLGLFYDSQERYEDAEVQYQRVLRGREEVFGKEHTLTLQALHWLGSVYNRMTRFDEAEETLRYVLEREEELLGKDHEMALDTLEDLGTTLFLQERWADAEPVFQRAVSGAVKTFGKDHVATLSYMHDLARVYAQLGKMYDAEVVYKRVLSGREKILEEKHELILDVIHDLGVLYVAQGREAEAEEFLYRAWTMREKVLGEEHDDTYESAISIYNLWLSQGRYARKDTLAASPISSHPLFNWFPWKRGRV
jgi:tetratricopeptide (TPR) repeat protein